MIWSWLDKASTGPGIELDKGNYSDIEIWNNSFKILNGAGIWMFDRAVAARISTYTIMFLIQSGNITQPAAGLKIIIMDIPTER